MFSNKHRQNKKISLISNQAIMCLISNQALHKESRLHWISNTRSLSPTLSISCTGLHWQTVVRSPSDITFPLVPLPTSCSPSFEFSSCMMWEFRWPSWLAQPSTSECHDGIVTTTPDWEIKLAWALGSNQFKMGTSKSVMRTRRRPT